MRVFELTCSCTRCLEHVPTTSIETGFAGETEQLCERCLAITKATVNYPVCAGCDSGQHGECIGQGCYCDCQVPV